MDKAFRQKLVELYKLIVARSDITASLGACDLMLTHVKDFFKDYKHGLYSPFLNAIIICYARPFTQNKPFGPLGKKWSKFKSKKYQAIHNDLIKYRNNSIAHSDFNIRNIIVYPEGTKMNGPLNYEPIGVSVTVSSNALSIEYIKEIREVCYDLGSRINSEVEARLADIFGNENIPKQPINLGELLGLQVID